MMMNVRPATLDMFDAIHDVLVEAFGQGIAKSDWRRLVDYDFARARDERGWALFDGDEVVGFLGAIYSLRGDDRFCNLTAWAVKKRHRAASLELLLPMLELRDHTLLNLSPDPFTLSVFRRMGFRDLDDRIVLVPPVLPQRAPDGFAEVTDPARIAELLTPEDRRIFEDHRNYACTHLLFAGADRYSYVVGAKTRFRSFPTTYIYYRSDPELFRALAGPMQRAFRRLHGTFFSVVDARLTADAPLRGCPTWRLAQPRLYRPAATSRRPASAIDALYTELVMLEPSRWTFNY